MPLYAPFGPSPGLVAALSLRRIFGMNAGQALGPALIAAATGVVLYAAYRAARAMARRRRNGMKALLRELCREHALDATECRDLVRAARTLGPSQGVQLFVDFDAWKPLLVEGQTEDHRSRWETVRNRLFS